MDDRRARIRKAALRSDVLTWRELAVLAGLTELPNEIDPETGRPPRDCFAMTAEGKFRHRQEYVAATFGLSPQQTKLVFKNLRNHGALSTLSPGAHGRASSYQALVLRGSKNNPLERVPTQAPRGSKNVPATPTKNNPLSGSEGQSTRGAENDPLTYRTPDHRNHSPAPREEPSPVVTKKSAAKEEQLPTSSASPVAAAFGRTTTCPHGMTNGDQREVWGNKELLCPACRREAS